MEDWITRPTNYQTTRPSLSQYERKFTKQYGSNFYWNEPNRIIDLFRQTRPLGVTLNCTISGCCVAHRPEERDKWEKSPECWCIEELRLQAAEMSHLKRHTNTADAQQTFVPILNEGEPVQFVPHQMVSLENLDVSHQAVAQENIQPKEKPKQVKPKLSKEEIKRRKQAKIEAKRAKLAATLARVKQRKLQEQKKKKSNGRVTRWNWLNSEHIFFTCSFW